MRLTGSSNVKESDPGVGIGCFCALTAPGTGGENVYDTFGCETLDVLNDGTECTGGVNLNELDVVDSDACANLNSEDGTSFAPDTGEVPGELFTKVGRPKQKPGSVGVCVAGCASP